MSDNKQIMQTTIQEMLEKMDFQGSVEVTENETGPLVAKIQSDEAGFLIGQGGENLAALQHLARAIINRRSGPELVNFIIDVNDYRANRLELLKEMALDLAAQVKKELYPKILEPMPAYERRIIHMALQDFQGIKTESQGEGEERRIAIRPADIATSD